jgi:hypothetical protein
MRNNLVIFSVALFLTVVFVFCAEAAQTCNKSIASTTPDARFTVRNDGTVTHKPTGLMWMRCSLGQTWDGKTCSGEAAVFSWGGALQAASRHSFAGHTDWRLPNKNELTSIVEEACTAPAINEKVFPATPPLFFWSSSPYAGLAHGAWSVDFGFGPVNASVKSGNLNARLVRGGP